ncbi:MAG TPA: hypothetical protein VHI93_08390 [Candidatus Thermoplasmatota archaeon]|nr:hypothetical protein [Candidatus Thermoplasmatota archaeon]
MRRNGGHSTQIRNVLVKVLALTLAYWFVWLLIGQATTSGS